jgi:galactokinase/mevalonate kinase-like predicted kinase
MIFVCPGNTRYQVAERLAELGIMVENYSFTSSGCAAWKAEMA